MPGHRRAADPAPTPHPHLHHREPALSPLPGRRTALTHHTTTTFTTVERRTRSPKPEGAAMTHTDGRGRLACQHTSTGEPPHPRTRATRRTVTIMRGHPLCQIR